MRYSSALALGTIAVGQAAAAGNRHANFHARRNANNGLQDVDAVQLARDLKDVNWNTIDWSSVFATQQPTPTPTPTPEVQVKVTPAAVTPSSTPVPTPSSQQVAKPSETAKPSPTTNIVESLFEGIVGVMDALKMKAKPQNSVEPNGALWLGDKGTAPLRVKHINKSGKDMTLWCWVSNSGYTGFTINVNSAAVGISLPKDGSAVVTSHGNKVPFGCSPIVPGIGLPFGGVNNTWFEGEQNIDNGQVYGTFDISRNPNMNGTPISSQGSKCSSNMETCVFKCTKSNDNCVTDYDLFDCGPHNGGHKGYDQKEKGSGGGCSMSAEETITVNYG